MGFAPSYLSFASKTLPELSKVFLRSWSKISARVMALSESLEITEYSELLTLILTFTYSAIVVSDIIRGGPHLTCPTWFDKGFCVWNHGGHWNSHALCMYIDLPLGTALAWINWTNYRRQVDLGLRI